jgi:homoserine/homoserine lactone efflux protein
MSAQVITAFVLACVFLGLTPGPNMSLIIANTLRGGLAGGLVTLAGTSTGLAVLVAGATFGMSSLMLFMSDWFDVIRWLGALYLVYLGARQMWFVWCNRAADVVLDAPKRGSWYAQGVLVSLSNPKVLLFLGAFLPQFVDPTRDTVLQLTVLAITFVVVLGLVDVAYTLALAKARTTFNMGRLRLLDGVAGTCLLLGGLALATLRRP